MKTPKLLILIFLILGMSLSTFSQKISLTKRQYRKGYYIQKNEKHLKKKQNKRDYVVINKQHKNIKSDNEKFNLEKDTTVENEICNNTNQIIDTTNNEALSFSFFGSLNKTNNATENLIVRISK